MHKQEKKIGVGQNVKMDNKDWQISKIHMKGITLQRNNQKITLPLHVAEELLDMQDNKQAA